ncbi:MAG: lipoprotein-releasing system ATP-binding protein [Phycisphaerales bacterium]|jgi:lipoprotein-releasing system ATP-binding protein
MSEASTTNPETVLVATGLHKTYKLGRVKVPVLHGVDISARRGEWVAVLGASGSGKSTMLHLLGGLDRPDKPKPDKNGETRDRASIQFEGREITSMSGAQLDAYKATDAGFVFQFYHLLPELTVLENVTLGAMIKHGVGYLGARREAVGRAKEILGEFGLDHRLGHRPVELSGGERQRVALARALINGPRLLLADEPTGNLDRETGDQILGVLAGLRERLGLTMVMVTHDAQVAQRADRTVRLVDGRVEGAQT